MKPFKQLLGNRIYLEIPKKEESSIIVDHATKEDLQKEMLKKMSKLKVVAVGDTVTTIKEGDVVLVDPSALSKAMIIPINDETDVLLASVFDVVHIW